MTLRRLCGRTVSSMLALSIGGSLLGLGAHLVSAQSVTVTTAFPYCVNNQAFPKGTYRFTYVSQWILSIQDVNGGGESLFLVQPEDRGPQSLAHDPVRSAGGVTFSTIRGMRELKDVSDPGSDVTLELVGQGMARDKWKTYNSLNPKNCFAEKPSIRGQNRTGQ